jgi:hypothetical protein
MEIWICRPDRSKIQFLKITEILSRAVKIMEILLKSWKFGEKGLKSWKFSCFLVFLPVFRPNSALFGRFQAKWVPFQANSG